MTSPQDAWCEVGERLEALVLRLKMHLEQSQGAAVPDALGRLRQGVEDVFEAAGNAVKDEEVRGDVREVGRLVGDAVTTTCPRSATRYGTRCGARREPLPALIKTWDVRPVDGPAHGTCGSTVRSTSLTR